MFHKVVNINPILLVKDWALQEICNPSYQWPVQGSKQETLQHFAKIPALFLVLQLRTRPCLILAWGYMHKPQCAVCTLAWGVEQTALEAEMCGYLILKDNCSSFSLSLITSSTHICNACVLVKHNQLHTDPDDLGLKGQDGESLIRDQC